MIVDKLENAERIVFNYCDDSGNPAGGAFPANPNGSLRDIAGITDETGLILGMMPHPERHLDGTNHPRWPRKGIKKEGDGLQLFRNAVNYVKGN